MVKNLFKEYMSDSGTLPTQFFSGLKESTDMRKARKIADYIAGMTDRFAISEYERLL
jgi:dGTPase